MLQKANANDYSRIVEFYKYVAENTPNMAIYGRWIYGIYPTSTIIKSYIDGGFMYYVEDDNKIVAAVAITPFQTKDYHGISWSKEFNDNEVTVIHVLCVDPTLQQKGYAQKVVEEVVTNAKENGQKSVRLDALSCNIPAHKLYEKVGFKKCDVKKWYADNTGWIDFYLFEYNC